MIIRGGENIYPAEIENILLKMKEIDDAHVIGVPDERVGEEVAAYIKGKVRNIEFGDRCWSGYMIYRILKKLPTRGNKDTKIMILRSF